MATITPFIWFDGDSLGDALAYYAGIFPDMRTLSEQRGPDGGLFYATLTVAGQTLYGLNGGPGHPHSDAFSLFVMCDDQAEVDRYWDPIAADGTPEACGWVVDKFGVTWQIVPRRLMELQADPDPARAKRTMDAMMTMVKLDVAALEAAANG